MSKVRTLTGYSIVVVVLVAGMVMLTPIVASPWLNIVLAAIAVVAAELSCLLCIVYVLGAVTTPGVAAPPFPPATTIKSPVLVLVTDGGVFVLAALAEDSIALAPVTSRIVTEDSSNLPDPV